MARIWQEGFESGLPNDYYLENGGDTTFFNHMTLTDTPQGSLLDIGRTSEGKCLKMWRNDYGVGFSVRPYILKQLIPSKNEIYLRWYFKYDDNGFLPQSVDKEFSKIIDTDGNAIFYMKNVNNYTTPVSIACQVRIGGTLTTIATVLIENLKWYRFDLYLKADSSTGAYEFKIDNSTVASDNNIDTGSNNIAGIKLGAIYNTAAIGGQESYSYYDDIALNDTVGSINNSWCGNGTIIALKPNGIGNKSEFNTSQGWVLSESGTTTTNITISGHGLSTGDMIYNFTRLAYRVITYVDADNFTVSSVTSQSQNDKIVVFEYQNTFVAEAGTDSREVVITGHNLISYDVFINETRSNAIRPVVYVSDNIVYNYSSPGYSDRQLGETVTSQTSGDSIKTFKVKQYPITNHYEAISNEFPNPQYSNIRSSTPNNIDTFDMEELVLDKQLPSNAVIVSVAHNVYAKEMGAGSTYQPVFRINGTDYTGETINLTGGTLQYQQIYQESPDTSSTWTVSEIDALEAGIKII